MDNFYLFTNSEPTDLFPNNDHGTFSVSFPHRKDFSVNESWEVAVTSLSFPLWVTNPTSDEVTKWLRIRLDVQGSTVEKVLHPSDGYYTCRGDFIDTIKLLQPIYVYKDDEDLSLYTIDMDDYFDWQTISTTDKFVLDTSALFREYPNAVLRIVCGHLIRNSIQIARMRSTLYSDIPIDNRVRSVPKGVYDGRDGMFYTHKYQVLVHSNLTGSPENPQKIIFHSAEINKPQNHTPYGTVNLVPDQLEYHKVTSENFSHMNFKITDGEGLEFDWLHETPVSLGLHFRKRYYINMYK